MLLEVRSYQPPSIQILSEAETIKAAININESAQRIHLTRYAVLKYWFESKVERRNAFIESTHFISLRHFFLATTVKRLSIFSSSD